MGCTWPESLPSSKKKAIEELVQGRDIANQLRSLLNKSAGNNNNKKAAPTEDLVLKILKSFTNMWWSVWGFVRRKVKENEFLGLGKVTWKKI